MRNRWVQMVIIFVVLLAGAFAIWTASGKKLEEVKIGGKAPDFKLATLDGEIFELADFKGQGLVLNFWGTFCPPCVREMPALQKQSELWKGEPVRIIGVNLNESLVTVRMFMQQHQISFPTLMDNDQVRKTYRVNSYPTTFYIDANGVIQDIFVGEMKEKDIQTRIEKILGSKP
ncbi:redoxin domain-containing protein [Paenibacillus eucommiae]|uniref:Peroxiredoxin n=1 Tax=Paenibacillus eucommiae TaxID=1355755 RepID=A0ABS4IS33_9BACL|nr:redoxin domain-containing protein [Paenibacillus eucommiae]MBP1989696.1 peroxiredoxin [Paenibacillus eucommiae]